MTQLDDHIKMCEDMIARPGSQQEINKLAKLIAGTYNNDIPNIQHYRGSIAVKIGEDNHYVEGIEILRAKLVNFREKQEKDTQAKSQIEVLVSECDEILQDDNIDQKVALTLIDRIVGAYSPAIPEIGRGLESSFSSGEIDYCKDVRILRTVLLVHKENLDHEKEMALLNHGGVNVNQTLNSEISVSVSFQQTIKTINELPEDELSAEEKNALRGMLANINFEEDKKTVGAKVCDVLKFIADKSVNVLIATIPYIAQALNSL